MILETRALWKEIKGQVVLDNINIYLTSGNVYGFVGKNGSGKTMLFRALTGLIHVSGGEIICDKKILYRDITHLPNLGLLLVNASLYPEFTGKKNLELLAKINGKIDERGIERAIERVGLDPREKKVIRKYSLGMRQRITIAQAIMEEPDILILDEPTNALDEEGVERVHKIIIEEKNRGAIVLLASHNKEDIFSLSDKIYIMERGKILEERLINP